MNAKPNTMIFTGAAERIGEKIAETTLPASPEERLQALGIKLPPPPEPFGTYKEAVQTGSLLFLTGMLPTSGREAKFVGRLGAELNAETCREAARLAAINALAVTRHHLGSLDRVKRIVRLGVFIAAAGDVRDHPKVADGASDLLQDVFGPNKNPTRLVYGVGSLPLGTPVELETHLRGVASKYRHDQKESIYGNGDNCGSRDKCDE